MWVATKCLSTSSAMRLYDLTSFRISDSSGSSLAFFSSRGTPTIMQNHSASSFRIGKNEHVPVAGRDRPSVLHLVYLVGCSNGSNRRLLVHACLRSIPRL